MNRSSKKITIERESAYFVLSKDLLLLPRTQTQQKRKRIRGWRRTRCTHQSGGHDWLLSQSALPFAFLVVSRVFSFPQTDDRGTLRKRERVLMMMKRTPRMKEW